MSDEIGRRTSRELTAARSALGAVNSALEVLNYVDLHQEQKDPAHDTIRRSLLMARAQLIQFRRTGRPRKAKSGE